MSSQYKNHSLSLIKTNELKIFIIFVLFSATPSIKHVIMVANQPPYDLPVVCHSPYQGMKFDQLLDAAVKVYGKVKNEEYVYHPVGPLLSYRENGKK